MAKTVADSHGEEQLGKLGDEEEEPATERRRECTDLGFDLGEREDQVVCHASAFAKGDDQQSALGSGGVSLAIFITSVSGSESLTSFTNRIFHFSGPPGFRMACDSTERNGRFGRIQCQRSEESSSRGERRVFICRRTVGVKVGDKVIPASFLKVERRRTLVGEKDKRESGR